MCACVFSVYLCMCARACVWGGCGGVVCVRVCVRVCVCVCVCVCCVCICGYACVCVVLGCGVWGCYYLFYHCPLHLSVSVFTLMCVYLSPIRFLALSLLLHRFPTRMFVYVRVCVPVLRVRYTVYLCLYPPYICTFNIILSCTFLVLHLFPF